MSRGLGDVYKRQEKDPIEIYVDGSTIVLKKFVPNCIFCGSDKDLTQYRDKQICKKCINKISTIDEK